MSKDDPSDVLFTSTEEELNAAYKPDEYFDMPEGLVAASVALSVSPYITVRRVVKGDAEYKSGTICFQARCAPNRKRPGFVLHEVIGNGILKKDTDYHLIVDILEDQIHEWLEDNYPEYKDPSAYWDDLD